MAGKSVVLLCVLACGGCIGSDSREQVPLSEQASFKAANDDAVVTLGVARGRPAAGSSAPAARLRKPSPASSAVAQVGGFQFERVIVDAIVYDWVPEHVVVGDVTGDARPDVVMSMSAAGSNGRVLIRIYTQLSDGSLAAPLEFKVERALNWLHSLELADLDADGVQDIALADDTGLTTISRVNGSFITRWHASSGRYSALVAIDANSDGNMDVFAQGVEYGSRFFLGDGRGGFSAVQYVDTGYGAYAVAEASDFTADGRPDLVVSRNGAYYVKIYPLLPGLGLQSQPFTYDVRPLQSSSDGATVGDLDRDGRPDLVITDPGNADTTRPRGVRILYRGAGDQFMHSVLLETPGAYTYPSSVAVADLDRNGFPDIVVMYDSSDRLGYFLQGPTGFAPVATVLTDDNPWTNNHYGENSFAIADVNSDQCPDIVLSEVSSSLRIFYGRNCNLPVRKTGGPLPPEQR